MKLGVYFAHMGGEETPGRIAFKFCLIIWTQDIITCIKFCEDRLRGFWSAGGGKVVRPFLYWNDIGKLLYKWDQFLIPKLSPLYIQTQLYNTVLISYICCYCCCCCWCWCWWRIRQASIALFSVFSSNANHSQMQNAVPDGPLSRLAGDCSPDPAFLASQIPSTLPYSAAFPPTAPLQRTFLILSTDTRLRRRKTNYGRATRTVRKRINNTRPLESAAAASCDVTMSRDRGGVSPRVHFTGELLNQSATYRPRSGGELICCVDSVIGQLVRSSY